jgi:PAS domain S-box-containing protein
MKRYDSMTKPEIVAELQKRDRKIAKMQRQAEETRAEALRLRELVEGTGDWIWEVDASGVYTYVSPQVEEILGLPVYEIVGKTPFDMMPPHEAARVGKTFGEIIASKRAFSRLENVNLHRDGHEVVLETSGAPILDAEGDLLGYRGIDRDITERVKLENELRASHDELEDRVRERTEALRRQAEEMNELSTPVVRVWDGILAAPLIGNFDAHRAELLMESLLEEVADTQAEVLIIDVTGMPEADTATAKHLISTVEAVSLLGAQVIMTGIRASIAQALVHLGIDLSRVETYASMQAGLRVAIQMVADPDNDWRD